jgi:hypothetical protein
MKLEIVTFIQDNENWQEVLKAEPYCLDIKHDGDFVLLSYNQISSNFNYKMVQEARGIIFHLPSKNPVCIPFTKFFNVQEGLASPIDWSTAKVQEKVDGSIIKVWNFDDEWHISTNGTIDADNATLQTPSGDVKTYLDLFLSAENLPEDFFSQLDSRYTYMFELVSPWNRVVVPYKKTEVYFIGARSNVTFNEVKPEDCDLEIQTPNVYPLSSLEDCLESATYLPFTEEGYVVVDENFNRVKVKGVQYIVAHHLKNNGIVTKSRILDMIRVNGQDDFLSIYEEYTEMFMTVLNGVQEFETKLRLDWHDVSGKTFETRKDLALYVRQTNCPACMFSLTDKKFKTVNEWLWSQQNDKILEYIGLQ